MNKDNPHPLAQDAQLIVKNAKVKLSLGFLNSIAIVLHFAFFAFRYGDITFLASLVFQPIKAGCW